jgi:organic hydroperoxide reductase OsmC/OhrA
MMSHTHLFEGELHWTGHAGEDEHGKLKLERAFELRFEGKAPLEGSSPAVFRGDDSRHNPETLLVASLMACHHLTYLAVCERAGIRLLEYRDSGAGTLAMKDGKMRMVEVRLAPQVRIADAAQLDQARELHSKAHAHCFISNSVNFEVKVEPAVTA